VVDDVAAEDPLWFKDAIIYELHVRAFHDASGDGIGDFKGLTEKLDYLQDLGVTAIWLLPFYPSPLRDDGYDIADYDAIHPDYGTMRQFKRFVEEAHDRGLKVITELVINHTSDQHPWFQRAIRAPKGSPERDFYVWSDTPEKYDEVRIIFQDFESSNWTWNSEAGQYYWHRFYHHQPDLNFDNPAVREAVKDALDFWAETGVDGMRLDAIPYLYEREGTNGENLPETHEFLKELRSHLDQWPGRMFLAEANQWPEDAAAYFGDGDECHMNFHFPLMPRLFMAVAQEDRFPIIDILQQTPEIPEGTQWGVFLRNHDELTLEMVTDEERDYMYRAYARDQSMRVNLGIRRRLAPLLGNDRRLIELMNSLLFSMPGTPVLYYGDEIGMGDNVYLGDRNGVRTPMQWSPDRNAGFSKANPHKLFLPVIIDPEYHYESLNVEAQQNNPRSLLWWMKRMIALRKRTKVFGRGDIDFLYPDNGKILAFVRSLPAESSPSGQEERVLVVANLSRHAQHVELDLSDYAGDYLIEMQGRTTFPPAGDDLYPLSLGPYQYHWFSLERTPSRIALSKMPELADTLAEPEIPTVTVHGDWRALLRGRGKERLASAMPDVLRRQRWFGGKAREIREVDIRQVITVGDEGDGTDLEVLIVHVEYVDGEPEEYVVPVGFTPDGIGRRGLPGQALLAHVQGVGKGVSGELYDAMADPEAAATLLSLIATGGSVELGDGELVGAPRPALRDDEDVDGHTPHPMRAEQSNTSVIFGDRYLLKILRRLESGVSPDVEVGSFLADHGTFANAPELVGTLDHRSEGGPTRTVALVQRFVQNEGDAWSYTLDELERFGERVLSEPPRDARPMPKRTPSAFALSRSRLPEAVHEVVGPYLESVVLLGQRTAEMHAALATGTDPAFRPEEFTSLYQRSLYQSMRNAVRKGLAAAKRDVKVVDDRSREHVLALAERESEILERLKALSTTKMATLRTRIHGDYHLGQVLWTGRDFIIIDFEGEPARPLGERRLKRSPLRDVAGMVRSFQYATASTLQDQLDRGHVTEGSDAHEELSSWLDWWLQWVSAAYLRGYAATIRGAGILPDDPSHTALLLDAFLLEKAIYELGYEMNNRPEWVDIPLAGIAQVLDHPEG
jgi:maltose alpha-D-glucosyltransferase/alpha-amylase